MKAVALWLFAGGLAVGLYSYLLYPLLLRILCAYRRKPPFSGTPAQWPLISIIVPAFNEERAIKATLDTILATDYPADRRQILVVSDASTDATDDIVRGYAAQGVELLRMPQRGGKTAAENAARSHLRGEIVINTDASVRMHRDGLKPLVSACLTPGVGVASGRDVSTAGEDTSVNPGESGYVGYEMWVRDLESRVGSIVGASGCFYAIRRDLHMTLVPEALSRDFAAALIAREHGFRAVSVNDAVCYVPRTGSVRAEYRRKVRTMTRGLETLWFKRHLLHPVRHGQFAWSLASHKLARWLMPWGLLVAALALALLAPSSPWAAALLGLGGAVLVLAAIGWWWPEDRHPPRLVMVPAYVVSSTLAGLQAWLKAISGELNPVWEPTRRPSASA